MGRGYIGIYILYIIMVKWESIDEMFSLVDSIKYMYSEFLLLLLFYKWMYDVKVSIYRI